MKEARSRSLMGLQAASVPSPNITYGLPSLTSCTCRPGGGGQGQHAAQQACLQRCRLAAERKVCHKSCRRVQREDRSAQHSLRGGLPHLAGQRLEEGRGPHDGVGDVAGVLQAGRAGTMAGGRARTCAPAG